MAYSEYPTELPLDRFAELAGIHPFHFNQLKTPIAFAGRREVGCDKVIYQHLWQSDGGVPGRNEIAAAIWKAERDMEQYLHFPLIRKFVSEELLPQPVHEHRASVVGHGAVFGVPIYNPRRFSYPVKVSNAHVLTPGVRATQEIALGVGYALSDDDGDGYDERVTLNAITLDQATYDAMKMADELRVFYAGKGPDPVWEIRPINVTVNPTTLDARISFGIHQLVDPKLYEQFVPEPLDPDDAATFLNTVDVYRVYPDSTIGSSLEILCHDAAVDSTHFSIAMDDPEGGVLRILRPWVWGGCGCARPIERISYVAGYPRSTFTRMDHAFERATVALSLANLGGICSCQSIPKYSRDLSVIGQTETSQGNISQTKWALKPPDDVMKNPFGTSEGANIAWTTIVTEIAGETANDYL